MITTPFHSKYCFFLAEWPSNAWFGGDNLQAEKGRIFKTNGRPFAPSTGDAAYASSSHTVFVLEDGSVKQNDGIAESHQPVILEDGSAKHVARSSAQSTSGTLAGRSDRTGIVLEEVYQN